MLDVEKHDPQSGVHVRRIQNQNAHDPTSQVITVQYVYEIIASDGTRTLEDWTQLGYLYHHQCADLFQRAGLTIAAEYGFYNQRPLVETEKQELIVVLEASTTQDQ